MRNPQAIAEAKTRKADLAQATLKPLDRVTHMQLVMFPMRREMPFSVWRPQSSWAAKRMNQSPAC